MKIIKCIVRIIIISAVMVSCDHFGQQCKVEDSFSVYNETGKELLFGMENRSPRFVVEYLSDCVTEDTLTIMDESSVQTYSVYYAKIQPNETNEMIITVSGTLGCCTECAMRNSRTYEKGSIKLFNLTDTTSHILEFELPRLPNIFAFEETWTVSGTLTKNQYTLTVTDSLVGLMRKDYSMLERFADYYSSAGQ